LIRRERRTGRSGESFPSGEGKKKGEPGLSLARLFFLTFSCLVWRLDGRQTEGLGENGRRIDVYLPVSLEILMP
jgi:hypothetical protein